MSCAREVVKSRSESRRRHGWTAPAGGVLAAVLLATARAWAIEPDDQLIPDPVNPLSLFATGSLTGGDTGTGTVVGAKLVGTTGYVAILTANHVAAKKETDFALGQGNGLDPYPLIFSTSSYVTYTIVDPTNNPGKLPEDISLILGEKTDLTKGSAALTLFNQLSANLPTITDPAKNPFPAASATNKVPFTQIGYGGLGQYDANLIINGKTYQAYQQILKTGERAFENNMATSYMAPSVVTYANGGGTYFEPITTFQVLAPSNSGGGGAMRGDSGGPMYTQAPAAAVSVTVNRDGENIKIPISYTNSLSAVWVSLVLATVSGQLVEPDTSIVGSNQFGVPIDQGLYNWIKPYAANPQSIPEPSSAALLGLGGLGLIAWTRRRAALGALRLT